ncbi:MAG: hypothetical protein LH609_04020 [Rudanella sp.]|nr:hypothetical protein [Rudanella sp.]
MPDGIFKGLDFPTDYFDIYYSYNNRGYVEFWNGMYRYPCKNYETNFYFMQTVDGCESDKAKTIYQELCREEAFHFDEFVYMGRVGFTKASLSTSLGK